MKRENSLLFYTVYLILLEKHRYLKRGRTETDEKGLKILLNLELDVTKGNIYSHTSSCLKSLFFLYDLRLWSGPAMEDLCYRKV